MTALASVHDVDNAYALVSAEARWARNQFVFAGPLPNADKPAIVRTVELRELPFKPVLKILESFKSLAADWDSYGGVAPTSCAFSITLALVNDLSLRPAAFGSTDLVPFSVAPVATGGIKLEWRRSDAALEIWIEGDGQISSLLDYRNAEPRFEERMLNSIPAAVAEVLAFAA